MKNKPDKKTRPGAYANWVRGRLAHWTPADDKAGPDDYVPRFDGVRACDVEGQSEEIDAYMPEDDT